MATWRIPLRVVFYRESDSWVAHCLEFDLIGDGPTHADAIGMLNDAIDIQVSESLRSGNLDNLFSPADGQYLRMFAEGRNIAKGELQLVVHESRIDVSEWEPREYDPVDTHPTDAGLAVA